MQCIFLVWVLSDNVTGREIALNSRLQYLAYAVDNGPGAGDGSIPRRPIYIRVSYMMYDALLI